MAKSAGPRPKAIRRNGRLRRWKGWRSWKIENIRLITQVFGLVIGNGMLIGIPLFGASYALKNIYFPNASTKFFFNAPTYATLYKVQDTLFSGWNSMYIDLLLPLLIFVALTIPLGRVWCAWLCPLGLPQDLLTRLRRKLGIRHIEISPHHSDFIHSLKYMGVFVIVFYTFALWYWEVDRGGPVGRVRGPLVMPAFAFPEMTNPHLVEDGWYPRFVDYLHLSFSTATSFSPSDASAIKSWAKLTMMLEESVSLVIAVLVVARAVNLLK